MAFVLGERPRRRQVDVFVRAAREFHRGVYRVGKTVVFDVFDKSLIRRRRRVFQFRVEFRRLCGRGDHAAEIFFCHGDRAAREVSESVRKIGVEQGNDSVICYRAVCRQRHSRNEIISHRVESEVFDQIVGVHHVAFRFAHLVVAEQEPRMREHLFRQRLAESHQEYRPVYRMETGDILAYDVDVARPVFSVVFALLVGRIAERRDVVCQSVEPDVNDVLRIKLNGDAPFERRARNAQILQSGLYEVVYHLAADVLRRDEIGIFLEEREQLVLIFAHFEEIRFFFSAYKRSAAVGANAAFRLCVGEERLVRYAVPALVFAFINVALLVELGEDFLHRFDVIVVRRSDKMRVRRAEQLAYRLYLRRNIVDVLLRRNARLGGVILNLLPVLVRSRTVEHVVAASSFVSCDNVSRNDVVRVSYVRLSRRVSDRRRYIKFTFAFH